MNRYRRHKLRAHDLGIDRHNKPVAHERKTARVEAEHAGAVAAGRRRAVRPEMPEAGSSDPHGPGCACRECP